MDDNNTAHFFQGIEIQCETIEQKKIIIEALNDMLILNEDELKNKEYPDCCKKGKKVKLYGVIYSHFVPGDSAKKLNDNFYKELKTIVVRKLIEKLLNELREDIKTEENSCS